jgi:hypothetical protein
MDIVKSLRSLVSALALIVSLVGVTTAPAYAVAGPVDCAPMQTMKQAHDCCKAPATVKACCSDRNDASGQGGPIQSRVQINPNLMPAPGIFVALLSPADRSIVRADGMPPRSGPVDLPTLLSTLLL